MNEIEAIKKIAENQGDSQTPILTKKLSFNSKQWDLAKKSTQASSNINYEINQTQTSLQNIYGENKFKIQYEISKKQESSEIKNEKRFSKFEVKIDQRKSSKIKALSAARTQENFKFRCQFIEIKSQKGLIINESNFEIIDSANKFLKSNNLNVGFSLSVDKKLIRKDAFGVAIVKEIKKHKVSFFDLLQKKDDLNANKINNTNNNANNAIIKSNFLSLNSKNKLSAGSSSNNFYNFVCENEKKNKEFIEVIKIESFKKYNLRLNEEDKLKAVCSSCGCSIF